MILSWRRSLSPPLPSAILSPRLFLFCPVLTWQRRGFRVRSAAAVASTSLPALRDRRVGVQPPLFVEAAVSKHWGEKWTKPKHGGFLDYYPFNFHPNILRFQCRKLHSAMTSSRWISLSLSLSLCATWNPIPESRHE